MLSELKDLIEFWLVVDNTAFRWNSNSYNAFFCTITLHIGFPAATALHMDDTFHKSIAASCEANPAALRSNYMHNMTSYCT